MIFVCLYSNWLGLLFGTLITVVFALFVCLITLDGFVFVRSALLYVIVFPLWVLLVGLFGWVLGF